MSCKRNALNRGAIEAAGLGKAFGDRIALRGVDLRVDWGERIVLLGPNGAGKTTLLRLLALLLQPSAGQIRLGGYDPRAEAAQARHLFGFLGHQSALYPDLTAEENLLFYARLYRLPAADRRIGDLLERLNLSDRRHTRARALSRGLQQRLALARALLHDPPILLLDEPDTGLDAPGLQILVELLADPNRTVLLSTHHLDWAQRVADRAIVLAAGRITRDDAIDAIEAVGSRQSAVGGRAPIPQPLPPKDGKGRGAPREAPKGASRGAPTTEMCSHWPTQSREDTCSPPRAGEGLGEGFAPTADSRLPSASSTASLTTPLTAFLAHIWAVLWKDLMLEARRRELLGTMGLFTLLVLVVFTFALDLAAEYAPVIAPGALWVAYIFAGTLGLGRSFAAEHEWGTLEGLLLAPVHRGALYLAKMLGNLLFVLAVELVSLPIFVAFFNLPIVQPGLAPILLLGTIGFATVATLFAAMAANIRAREVLLPVLLFPIVIPVVIASVKATTGVIDGSGTGPWLNVLVPFDIIFLVVAFLAFDLILEE